jgi:hypothetical protein
LALPTNFGDQVLFRRRIVDQREIDLGGHQMHQRRARQALGQRHLQVRIFAEHRAHQRHADCLDAGIGHADRDLAGHRAAAFADFALGRRHCAQDDARVLIEPLAGRGRLHAAGLALEQGRCELGFEVGNVVAQRRLRDIRLIRRPRQVALLVDGDEIAKLPRVHGACRFVKRSKVTNAPFDRL